MLPGQEGMKQFRTTINIRSCLQNRQISLLLITKATTYWKCHDFLLPYNQQ